MSNTRVTVTLPSPLVRQIDRIERNRSRFVLEAIRHELERRRREQLWLSLENPHPESTIVEEEGLEDWCESLPEKEEDLVLPECVRPVQWTPEVGWELK
ncbi:MAG: hypothetical protein HY319_31285 [Armatimonadetes bacterium]|nr:hypothetical protein [Armatimonadota bacterium]